MATITPHGKGTVDCISFRSNVPLSTIPIILCDRNATETEVWTEKLVSQHHEGAFCVKHDGTYHIHITLKMCDYVKLGDSNEPILQEVTLMNMSAAQPRPENMTLNVCHRGYYEVVSMSFVVNLTGGTYYALRELFTSIGKGNEDLQRTYDLSITEL